MDKSEHTKHEQKLKIRKLIQTWVDPICIGRINWCQNCQPLDQHIAAFPKTSEPQLHAIC